VRLRQVLGNLIANAVKFTERGSVRVTARRLEYAGGAARLRIEVRDTGIGIAPDDQAALFRAFVQVDQSRTRRQGGTGLGLAIAKDLVGLMDGAIGCESAPGAGSLFWFEVPLNVRHELAPAPAPASVAAPAVDLGLAVLLAEDNPVNQEVAREALAHLGCRVTVAADGQQALAAWRAGRFDVVLMDCRMPEMDGFDATRAIRTAERAVGRPRTPIVALTANAADNDRAECLAAGMDEHMAKPFTLDQLRAVLSRRAALPGEPAVSPPPVEAPADALPVPFDPRALEPIQALAARGRPHVLARVIDAFLSHTPGLIATLQTAAATGDVPAMLHAAHGLKSSSANVGALRLAHLAKTLEQQARQGAVPAAVAEAAAIALAFQEVGPLLQDVVPRPVAASA